MLFRLVWTLLMCSFDFYLRMSLLSGRVEVLLNEITYWSITNYTFTLRKHSAMIIFKIRWDYGIQSSQTPFSAKALLCCGQRWFFIYLLAWVNKERKPWLEFRSCLYPYLTLNHTDEVVGWFCAILVWKCEQSNFSQVPEKLRAYIIQGKYCVAR